MTPRRPNFLFFIADQLRADHLGCYGHPIVRTPNIDAIAARGHRFDRCYVASAVCQPNRNTIMTGRMPSLHGTQQNGVPLALDAVCFTHLLRAGGWRTGLFGKAHFQNFTGAESKFPPTWPEGLSPPPDVLREPTRGLRIGPGYDREYRFDASSDPSADERAGDFYGFERFRVCTWHGDGVRGHYSHWLRERLPDADSLRGAVPPRLEAGCIAPQVRASQLPEDLYPTHYVADQTIAYLEERARDPGGEPFFVQCSFPDPHHPFTPPARYADMYDPADVVLPESFHRRPNVPPPMLARLHEDLARGTRRLEDWVAPYAVTEAEARHTIAATWGMVTLIDDAVGRVMQRLEALGLAKDTVVVFTSDHGDWMGDHGVMLKGPMHYQGLIRTPLVWADAPSTAASMAPPGRGVDALVSSLDLARSFLARAGLAAGNGMQGQDLAACMQPGGQSAHDCVIVEHQTSRPFPGFTQRVRVRTMTDGHWRMSLWEGVPFAELYDLESDPHELDNRWADPACSTKRAELTERMLLKMIDLQDRAPLPVGEA
jgi:arylsulfatase A-like enzyme